jgi:hypothetical protein
VRTAHAPALEEELGKSPGQNSEEKEKLFFFTSARRCRCRPRRPAASGKRIETDAVTGGAAEHPRAAEFEFSIKRSRMNLPYLFDGLYPHPALLVEDVSLEDQASWVDVVCVELCKSEEATKAAVLELSTKPPQFDVWNATSIGNAAYLILHSPSEQAKAAFRDQLEQYRAWKAGTFRKPTYAMFPKQWELYQEWLASDKKTPEFMCHK